MSPPSNRPSLDDIRSLPIGAIAALPPAHLALLQEDAEAAHQDQQDDRGGSVCDADRPGRLRPLKPDCKQTKERHHV